MARLAAVGEIRSLRAASAKLRLSATATNVLRASKRSIIPRSARMKCETDQLSRKGGGVISGLERPSRGRCPDVTPIQCNERARHAGDDRVDCHHALSHDRRRWPETLLP